MAVPKKKKSRSRSGNQASHDALKPLVVACDQDGEFHLSHRASFCSDGSYKYKGRVVIEKKQKSSAGVTA